MSARLIAVILLAASLAAPASERSMGNLRELPSTASQARTPGRMMRNVVSLPSSVDLSSSFPAPMNQGFIGSCVSWSSGYAVKSYYEKIDHGWAMDSDSQKFCANFLYNQVNGGRDGGSYVSDNFLILATRGCAPLSAQPYSWSDFYTWPTAAQCASALDYRNGLVSGQPYAWVPRTNLTAIKEKLADGTPLVMTMCVDRAWDYLGAAKNYVWHPNKADIRGWHAITVVGYDNAVTDGAGHVGALKIQNSWGRDWGNGGRAYVAYSALSTTSVGSAFYFGADRRNYASTIKGRVTVSHPKRGSVTITAGVGSASAPAWSYRFYDAMNLMDATHANVDTTIDLSAAASYWPPTEAQPWWIKVGDAHSDGSTGSLTAFSVAQGATTFASATTLPLSIPDGSNALVRITGVPPTVTAPVISSPLTASAVVGRAFTYRIVASNSPTSYAAAPLPAGLSVNTSTGVISGVTGAVLTMNVTITATNSAGSASATLALSSVSPAPVISSATNASATVGNRFAFRVTAENSPTSFSANNLPSGLKLNAITGDITGTPKSAGSYTVKLTARNATGSGTMSLKIKVAGKATRASVIGSTVSVAATADSAFVYQMTASKSPRSYSAVGLPDGLSINPATGRVSGTPTMPGVYNVKISAVNKYGTTVTMMILKVNAVSAIQRTAMINSPNHNEL